MRHAKEPSKGKLLANFYCKIDIVVATTNAYILVVSQPFVNPKGHEFSHQEVTPDA